MRSELHEGEVVRKIAKKHWIVLCQPIALILLGCFGHYYITNYNTWNLGGFDALLKDWILYGIYIALFFLALRAYDRKVNIWVVTNMRVIDEWGIISHNTIESWLEQINNVSCGQPVLGLVLGYGDVQIQTAAEKGSTIDRYVTEPKDLQKSIYEAKNEFMKKAGKREEENIKVCPSCCETIKRQAILCRYCGTRFGVDKVSEEAQCA